MSSSGVKLQFFRYFKYVLSNEMNNNNNNNNKPGIRKWTKMPLTLTRQKCVCHFYTVTYNPCELSNPEDLACTCRNNILNNNSNKVCLYHSVFCPHCRQKLEARLHRLTQLVINVQLEEGEIEKNKNLINK